MSKVIKEVFIILLLCMVVIFTIGLLFYDCIPQKNEKIESIEYIADKSVTNTIEQIKENSNADITNNEDGSLLKSYSIKKEDLQKFVSENYYETGKKDPFAEYADPVEEEIVKKVTIAPNATNLEANKFETKENKEKTETKKETLLKEENTTKEEIKESTTGKYIEKKNSK
jgi:hypothetical protein